MVTEIEGPLSTKLKESLPDVEGVKVTGFRKGSVIAEFDIIFVTPASANTTIAMCQDAIRGVIRNDTFSEKLNVDTSFIPVVEGKFIMVLAIVEFIGIPVLNMIMTQRLPCARTLSVV